MNSPSFAKVVHEFLTDLLSTYPELKTGLHTSLEEIVAGAPPEAECYKTVYEHVGALGHASVFSILTENPDLFRKECFLLPGIDFATLWKENITEMTKASIWKHLKLVAMSAVGDGAALKDAFEAATKGAQDFFAQTPPSAAAMEENLKGLIDGKLGSLAKEIADEAVGSNSAETMETMMKNPAKLFELVQTVGDRLDHKIKSGELKESELIEEASGMFSKIKDMPGFDQMMKQFTGGKMNMPGMQNKMKQNAKAAKTKERLQQKLKKRGAQSTDPAAAASTSSSLAASVVVESSSKGTTAGP